MIRFIIYHKAIEKKTTDLYIILIGVEAKNDCLVLFSTTRRLRKRQLIRFIGFTRKLKSQKVKKQKIND